MKNIFCNKRRKKAETYLIDFWAILIFCLVLILFLALFWYTKKDVVKSVDQE